MIAYDEVSEAAFKVMPKITKSTTELKPCKDFGTLKDQPSKMKNAMAMLLIPKYNGNRCAELDNHLIDTIGLRKPAKLLSNLTDGHASRTDGHPYIPVDSHFGDGPAPSIIPGYHLSDASMLSIHSAGDASGIGDDQNGQYPRSSMTAGKRGNAGDQGGSANKFAKTGRTMQTPRSISTPPATKTSLLSGQPSIDVRQLLQYYGPNPPPTIDNDQILRSLPATLRPGPGRTHNQAMTMLRDEATQLEQQFAAEAFATDYEYNEFAQKVITSGVDTKSVSLPDFVEFLWLQQSRASLAACTLLSDLPTCLMTCSRPRLVRANSSLTATKCHGSWCVAVVLVSTWDSQTVN